MRICGLAAEGLRGERRIHDTFPSKELQDYWSSRPHYQDEGSEPAAGGSSGGAGGTGQSYSEWAKSQGDEPPPPPYTLEATVAATTQPSQAPFPNLASRPGTISPPVVNPSSRPTPQHSVSADELADAFLRQSSISQQAGGPPEPAPRPFAESGGMFAAEQVMSPYASAPGTTSAPGGQTGYFPGQPQTRPPRKGFPSQSQIMQQYNSSQSSMGSSSAQSQPTQSPPAQTHPYHQPSADHGIPYSQPSQSAPFPAGPPPPNRPPGSLSPQPYLPQQQQQHRPQFPIASSALNMAFSAVGSVAGDERRRKLEEEVERLAQSTLRRLPTVGTWLIYIN